LVSPSATDSGWSSASQSHNKKKSMMRQASTILASATLSPKSINSLSDGPSQAGSDVAFPLPTRAPSMADFSQPAQTVMQDVRVLLVEDVAVNARLVIRMLAKFGVTDVTWAESGAEALEATSGSAFHIVFMDLNLEDMAGFEVKEKMHAQLIDPRTQFIAMTGASDVSSLLKVKDAKFRVGLVQMRRTSCLIYNLRSQKFTFDVHLFN
jgi:CheY-like chemotaxis protein